MVVKERSGRSKYCINPLSMLLCLILPLDQAFISRTICDTREWVTLPGLQ